MPISQIRWQPAKRSKREGRRRKESRKKCFVPCAVMRSLASSCYILYSIPCLSSLACLSSIACLYSTRWHDVAFFSLPMRVCLCLSPVCVCPDPFTAGSSAVVRVLTLSFTRVPVFTLRLSLCPASLSSLFVASPFVFCHLASIFFSIFVCSIFPVCHVFSLSCHCFIVIS